MSEENECKINNWIRNPGYQLIPIFIFECLDLESLATCRKVSTEWRDFVDELTSFWRRHLAKTRVLMEERQRVRIDGDLRFDRENYLIDSRNEEFLNVRDFSNRNDRVIRYFWTFWTHALDHYEFEVKDNVIVKEFVLLIYDYLEENRRYLEYDWSTPLHQAAKRGTNLYLFNYIIQNEFEFQITFRFKTDSFLFIACENGQKEVMELLLKNQDQLNINLSDCDRHGNTAFHLLCPKNEENLKAFLDLTKDRNFDYNSKNDSGFTAFHGTGDPEAVKTFLKYRDEFNLDLHTKERFGRTRLHWACVRGNFEVVKILLQESRAQGLDLDLNAAPSYSGDSPLHIATDERFDPQCQLSNPYEVDPKKLIKVLLENAGKGLDFFASNNAGRIPLKGHVKEYIDYCEATETQVDFKQSDKFGRTLLHFSIESDQGLQRLFDYLDRNEMRIDMNVQDKCGKTPLLLAVTNNSNVLRLFLNYCYEKDIVIQLQASDKDGNTVFHLAETSSFKELLKYSKQSGIDIDLNLKDKSGKNPFHIATSSGDIEKIEYFLSYFFPDENDPSIDINAQDMNGMTPLHLACKNKHFVVVEKLLQYNRVKKYFNTNILDINGLTAKDHADLADQQIVNKFDAGALNK